MRAVMRIEGMVHRGEVSWSSLPAAQREEAEEAMAMLTEAMAQGGHSAGNYSLGLMLENVRQDVSGAEAAYRAAIAVYPEHAAAQFSFGCLLHRRRDVDGAEAAFRASVAGNPEHTTHAMAHTNLAILLQSERQDFDGAEAAYRAAIAADLGATLAHYNLGILLQDERQDLEGAEAAFRAAIAADPMSPHAHSMLGNLVGVRAQQIEVDGGSPEEAATLWEEFCEHYMIGESVGPEDETVKFIRARATDVRAGRAGSVTVTRDGGGGGEGGGGEGGGKENGAGTTGAGKKGGSKKGRRRK